MAPGTGPSSATGEALAASAPAAGKAQAYHSGFINRLSTGTGAFNILGPRKFYYAFSAFIVTASIVLILVRGFNLSIDFAGGTQLTFTPNAGQQISTSQVAGVVNDAIGVDPDAVQRAGTSIEITTEALTADQVVKAKDAIQAEFAPASGVSNTEVSETWGGQITERALIAVIVFLIAVAIFISLRYERRVAFGAVLSVIHDLFVCAGVYALVGFQVSPSTVIGLLTILGFSLYDTVVVYDKVQENTKGLTSLLRRTYQEAANLAINQTLMRSVNTSLIALLPVAGLLTAGVVILGSGTLKDLSLVMLIGMIIGSYSSVFLAVPIAVDLKRRDPQIKAHTAKVQAKRRADGIVVDADGDPIGRRAADGSVVYAADLPVAALAGASIGDAGVTMAGPASPSHFAIPVTAPRPGARPVRPTVKPGTRTSAKPAGKAARPTGKRGR